MENLVEPRSLARLSRLITNIPKGFALVEVNQVPLRKQMIQALMGQIDKTAVVIDLSEEVEQMAPLGLFRQAVRREPDAQVFMLHSLELCAGEDPKAQIQFVRALNYSRDSIAALNKVWIFFLPTFFVELLLKHALDLMSFIQVRVQVRDKPAAQEVLADSQVRSDFESGTTSDSASARLSVSTCLAMLENPLLRKEERFEVLKILAEAYAVLGEKTLFRNYFSQLEAELELTSRDGRFLLRLSELLSERGDTAFALELCQRAKAAFEAPSAEKGADWIRAHVQCAILLDRRDQTTQALDALVTLLFQLEKHKEDDGSEAIQREKARAYRCLGDCNFRLVNLGRASIDYGKALAISEQLAAAKPRRADYQRDLTLSYVRLGDLAREQRKLGGSFYNKALSISEYLVKAEPQRAEYQRGLSVVYLRMGDLKLAIGQPKLATSFYGRALAIAERLAASEPQRTDYQRDLARTYMRLGFDGQKVDRPMLKKARDILLALKRAESMIPRDEKLLLLVNQLLEQKKKASSP